MSLYPSSTIIENIISYTNPIINLPECSVFPVTNKIIDSNSSPLIITTPATTAQAHHFSFSSYELSEQNCACSDHPNNNLGSFSNGETISDCFTNCLTYGQSFAFFVFNTVSGGCYCYS